MPSVNWSSLINSRRKRRNNLNYSDMQKISFSVSNSRKAPKSGLFSFIGGVVLITCLQYDLVLEIAVDAVFLALFGSTE